MVLLSETGKSAIFGLQRIAILLIAWRSVYRWLASGILGASYYTVFESSV